MMSAVLNASAFEKYTSSPIIPTISSVTKPRPTITGQLLSVLGFVFSRLKEFLL
jgi:hypothetical protein